jgi:hypothetical protein
MNRKNILLLFISFSLLFLIGCNSDQKTNHLLHNELTIHIGETKKIVSEDFSGTFYSTSDDVEINENGEVIGKGIGSAVIIAKDKSGNTNTCVVVVASEQPVTLEKIEIINPLIDANVGETVMLEYELLPKVADNFDSITFETSNSQIASINRDGKLITVSPGEATITVKANGTNVSEEFKITVNARENVVSLNYYDVTGNVGTSDLTINSNVETDYLNVDSGNWISNDPSIASVDNNGKISFKSVGKTEITYQLTINNVEYLKTCLVTVRDLTGFTIIRTPEQLQEIQNTSGNYALGNEIDMTEAVSQGGSLYHGGAGFAPLFNDRNLAFVGVFDGQGYAIKNIYINSSVNNVALFGFLSVVKGKEGIIRNLALIDGSITGENYTSVFAANVGSFTGSSVAGIYNSWTNVEVKSNGPASGFVGLNGGTIKNSFTLSKVTGLNSVGAFALRQCNNSSIGIENSYANSDINSNISELIPSDANASNVAYMNASFLTTEEMQQASNYDGWDINVWEIEDGAYPVLKTPYYQD